MHEVIMESEQSTLNILQHQFLYPRSWGYARWNDPYAHNLLPSYKIQRNKHSWVRKQYWSNQKARIAILWFNPWFNFLIFLLTCSWQDEFTVLFVSQFDNAMATCQQKSQVFFTFQFYWINFEKSQLFYTFQSLEHRKDFSIHGMALWKESCKHSSCESTWGWTSTSAYKNPRVCCLIHSSHGYAMTLIHQFSQLIYIIHQCSLLIWH